MVRVRLWLSEHQFTLVAALIPLVTVGIVVYTFASWPSSYAAWVGSACDGMRDAHTGLVEGDRERTDDGWRHMGGLDPAGEQPEADQSELQKLWAASDAVGRVIKDWDADSGGPPPVATEDQVLIDRGVAICESYDYPWFAPHRLLGPT